MSEPVEDEEKTKENSMTDPCPNCGEDLADGAGGGVVCNKPGCGYWFCY